MDEFTRSSGGFDGAPRPKLGARNYQRAGGKSAAISRVVLMRLSFKTVGPCGELLRLGNSRRLWHLANCAQAAPRDYFPRDGRSAFCSSRSLREIPRTPSDTSPLVGFIPRAQGFSRCIGMFRSPRNSDRFFGTVFLDNSLWFLRFFVFSESPEDF